MRKNLFLFFCVFLIFAFCSCGVKAPGEEIPAIKSRFSGNMFISGGKTDIACFFSREKAKTTYTFKAPSETEGLSYIYAGDRLSVTYRELSFALDKNYLPQKNLIGQVNEIFEEIDKKTYEYNRKDGEKYCFKLSGYFIHTDKNGNILTVTDMKKELYVSIVY